MKDELKELIKNIENGEVCDFAISEEINFEDALKSITVTKDSKIYELSLSEFFEKPVHLYYNRTTKLLPRIMGGKIIEAYLNEDEILINIVVAKGDDAYIIKFDEISDCPIWLHGESEKDSGRTLNYIEIGVEKLEEWEDETAEHGVTKED